MILLRPIAKEYPVSQRFGENPDWYPLTNGHNGVDYGTKLVEGIPIHAAADGVVTRANLDNATVNNPKRGYGYHVRIRHPDGSTTIYGHFMEGGLLVKTGQQVRMGDVIGRSGNTGFSTNPHLHFEFRLGESVTSGVDPEPFIVDEIPLENGLFDATITQAGDGVRIRCGPSTSYRVIDHLNVGEQVKVFGLAGNDAWLQVTNGFLMYDPKWYKIAQTERAAGLFQVAITNEGQGVRLRKGPSPDHEKIKNLKNGDQETVIGMAGDNAWFRIQQGFIFYESDWYDI